MLLVSIIKQDWRRDWRSIVGTSVSLAPEASRVMGSDWPRRTTEHAERAAANASVSSAVRHIMPWRAASQHIFPQHTRGPLGRFGCGWAWVLGGCSWVGLRAGRARRGWVALWRRWRGVVALRLGLRCVCVGVSAVLFLFRRVCFPLVVVRLAGGLSAVLLCLLLRGLLRLAFVLGVFSRCLLGFPVALGFRGFPGFVEFGNSFAL